MQIVIEQLAPLGTAAVSVAGSVYEDELPWPGSDTEECQSFGATLEMIVSDR